MTPKGKLAEFAAHVAEVKTLARDGGREIDVYTVCVVTCRPTQSEAESYYRHCVIDNADWAAVDRIMAMRGVTRETHPDDFDERRYHQANGMGGVPVVGDPDTVARDLAQISAAGARGIALSFVNYLDELPLFRDEVMPRLVRMGLRESQPTRLARARPNDQ
jgi:dimethylsulfone monooxygenase